jgi:hypothetical protein
MGHVAASLITPCPKVLDALLARGDDRVLELRNVLGCEAEARQPQLRADAVTLRGLAQQAREPPYERTGSLTPVLPIGVGDQ